MADTTLQSFSKKIDAKLVEPLRRVLIGRQLVPLTPPAGFGVSSVEWSKVTEMSGGMVSYAFAKGNQDTLSMTPTTSKVPVYWKDYSVDRRMYESFKNKGLDVDSSTALSAAFVAAKVEDEAIIDGVKHDTSNYDLTGLYPGAGNDFSTTADFATAGKPTVAVAGAYDLLEADDVPTNLPYNLVLAPTQRNQLRALRSANGIREEPEIMEMLNGGKIFSSNVMTAGTGMLLPVAEVLEPWVDMYMTVDWRTEHGFDSEHPETGDLTGRVYSGGILRIKENKVICKLSVI